MYSNSLWISPCNSVAPRGPSGSHRTLESYSANQIKYLVMFQYLGSASKQGIIKSMRVTEHTGDTEGSSNGRVSHLFDSPQRDPQNGIMDLESQQEANLNNSEPKRRNPSSKHFSRRRESRAGLACQIKDGSKSRSAEGSVTIHLYSFKYFLFGHDQTAPRRAITTRVLARASLICSRVRQLESNSQPLPLNDSQWLLCVQICCTRCGRFKAFYNINS